MRSWPVLLLTLAALGCRWSIDRVSDGYEIGQASVLRSDDPLEVRRVVSLSPAKRLRAHVRQADRDRGPIVGTPSDRFRLEVDWDFVAGLEGRGLTEGYVPTDARTGRVLGRSGVTIATGLDLGQHSRDDLRRMGVDEELVDLLRPYLKERGERALSLLERRPLLLWPDEVEALDRAKREDTLAKLARAYDRDRTADTPHFVELSVAQRTVIASVGMQYGTRLDRSAPAFWGHVVEGRFAAAANELRGFGDGYPTRRAREAALLERDLAPRS